MRELLLTPLPPAPPRRLTAEIVERKGRGHPDTLCDLVAEAFGAGLCRAYLERFGAILHHNVDKVLLRGGSSRPAFGGGRVLEPIELYLSGRATTRHKGVDVPVTAIAVETARDCLRRVLPELDPERHVHLRCLVRPGSEDLTALFLRSAQRGVPLANDTSCGVGHAPDSPLEQLVLAAEDAVRPAEGLPEVGADVKVMGLRHGQRLDLTLGCAFVDRHLPDLAAYVAARRAAVERVGAAADSLGLDLDGVAVNVGDDEATGSVFLTVTGTSAEAGDDGEAGRGNRADGLITPHRAMTMESLAGKNPVNHVGKLYNLVAPRIAADAVARLEPVQEATCFLVSRIGHPVDEPALVHLALRLPEGALTSSVRAALDAIVREHLEGLPRLWEELVPAGSAVS